MLGFASPLLAQKTADIDQNLFEKIKEAKSKGKGSNVTDYVDFLREKVAKFHQEEIPIPKKEEVKG